MLSKFGLESNNKCSPPLDAVKAMPHPSYKGKPIFALVDPKNLRGLEQVFEDVAEDKQMNDEQQQ